MTADPFKPAENTEISMSIYLVVDEPVVGFTDANIDYDVQGLFGFLGSSNVLKVLTGQS